MDSFLAPLMILLLAFIGATYYVLQPFLAGKLKVAVASENKASRLEALQLRKVSLYKQLREAEFEREMGVIDQEEYDCSRADVLAEVADVIRRLESPRKGAVKKGRKAERSAAPTGIACPECGSGLEPDARFCSSCGTSLGAACPSCGAEAAVGDRFCSNCGRGLMN